MDTRITSLAQLDLTKVFSYKDYLTWTFKERVELIRGYVRLMSPAPSTRHQLISDNLYLEISKQLTKKSCKIFYAPFDVRLKRKIKDEDALTVVQPDICVVCDLELLDEKGCNGAPSMIIEILSNSNSKHDLVTKLELYEEAGVNEYWIVYPFEKVIDVFLLSSGKYVLKKKYIEDEVMPIASLPGLLIEMKEIFED